MPQRNVATNFTFEQQRAEINLLAQDFWTQKGTVDTASTTYLKHNGSNAFTGNTLNVPSAFTINSDTGNGTVTIAGNLQVNGTTTTVNTATMDVVDKNITIAKGSANDAAADGAGITIDSATDITWNFVDANDAWVSSIGVEATTHVKAAYGHFTGSTTASAGSGVEVFAPDANTGQIQAYNRGTTAFNELKLKGSSVGVYTGSTNALAGTFNSTGLTMESGKTITSSGITVNGNTGIEIAGDNTVLKFTEGDANPDFGFLGNAGSLRVQDLTNTANLFIFESDKVRSIKNFDAEGGLDVSGNTTTTGHVSIANDKGIFFDGTTTTNDTIWRNSGENSLSISSRFNVNVFIDSNNDDTNASFTVSKDNTTKASSTELFRIQSGGQVLIGTETSNTSDRLTIVDPGNAFMSLRSDQQADGNSQVIDFAVGTGDRGSGNLVSTITAAIPTGATAGGTLKGYLAFSSNAGDSLSERVRINEFGNLVVGVNPTTSSQGSGKNNVPLVVYGPASNAINLMIGNSANGTTSLGANDYSGDIRFNGADVAWGDISYYPNGDGNGSFRFTRNGSTVSNNGNAAIGCGGLICNGGIVQNDNSTETAFGSKSLPAADSGYYVRNGNGGNDTYASIGLIASNSSVSSDQSASLVVQSTNGSNYSPEVYLTQRDGANSQRNVLAINTLGDATFIGRVSDHKGSLRRLPQTNKSAGYNLVADDAGKHINTTGDIGLYTGQFEIGDAVTIFNKGTAAIAISLGGGVTMYQAGTTNVGNRGLDAKGICTILCTEKGSGTNTFVISGAGLT